MSWLLEIVVLESVSSQVKVRTQNAWLLHLAGNHHPAYETKPVHAAPHMMRCMLSANLARANKMRVALAVGWR